MAWERRLEETLAEAWRRLVRGAADRRAASRHPVLATVAEDGAPAARVVVLRRADPGEGVLEVHTDAASAKAGEIAAEPRVALTVWEAKARLQIRVAAEAAPIEGAAREALWARVPEGARLAYGGTPAPGTVIAAPEDHAAEPVAARFLPLRLGVTEVETLHLGEDRHRRARFRRDRDWAGEWLAP